MMLHLGNDVGISWRSILAILNIESLDVGTRLTPALHHIQAFAHIPPQRVTRVSDDGEAPKTAVLAVVDNEPWLFLSPIASVTLLRRSEAFYYRRLRT